MINERMALTASEGAPGGEAGSSAEQTRPLRCAGPWCKGWLRPEAPIPGSPYFRSLPGTLKILPRGALVSSLPKHLQWSLLR